MKVKDTWAKKRISIGAPHLAGAFIIVAVLAFWGGTTAKGMIPFIGMQPVYDSRAPEEADLAPFFAAWRLLNENFTPATSTATVSSEEKLYGAIQGLAASFGDDYTVFFPPVQKQIFETEVNGGFEGVGMEIGKRNGILTVIAPIKDTPAARAGIKSGDFILEIDGESTADMAVDEAVSHIRGKGGTTVVLTLAREGKDDGKAFEVSVVRDTITLPTLDVTTEDGIPVIKVYSFNANAPDKFSNAIQDCTRSGGDKLIVDLRGNPGGYLEAASDMVSWFLPAGDIVVTSDYGSKQEATVYRSAGFGTLQEKGIKVVVLIDGGSASASEIFAGAMRDHKRATLIGTQSFGKGSVQQVFDVTPETSLKITIARWLTPNGTSISHEGLKPDVVVELPDEIEEGTDPILDRAVEFLNTGK